MLPVKIRIAMLAAIFGGFSGGACAADSDWIPVADDATAKVAIYFPNLRAEADGDLDVVVREDYATPQRYGDEVISAELRRYRIDCTRKVSGLLSGADYDVDGATIGSFNSPTDMSRPVSGSTADAVTQKVCSLKIQVIQP